MSLGHVESELQRDVVKALLSLNSNSSESKAANIASFQPALTNIQTRDLMAKLGIMELDPNLNRWRCAREQEMYTNIKCATGMFKKPKSLVENGCASIGLPCPATMTCLCSPCKKARHIELVSQVQSIETTCEKMQNCGVPLQNEEVTFTLSDNLGRANMQVTWELYSSTERLDQRRFSSWGKATVLNTSTNLSGEPVVHTFSLSIKTFGLHIIEVRLGNSQEYVPVEVSPVLIDVQYTNCLDTSRIADITGICVCDSHRGFVTTVLGECMQLTVLVFSIVIPIFMLMLVVLVCVWKRKPEEFYEIQALRESLGILRKHGYILSSEQPSLVETMRMCFKFKSREDYYVIIPKRQLEAALRLAQRENFDVHAFDVFCAIVEGSSRFSANQEEPLGPSLDPESGLGVGVANHGSPLLRKWLLEHTKVVLHELILQSFR